MQLRLKPHSKNLYPLSGILIKSSSVRVWIEEIQRLDWGLEYLQIFPLPNQEANSLWGCLLAVGESIQELNTGKHERCQVFAGNIFLPEYSRLQPPIKASEIPDLFSEYKHLLHPDIGWVELKESLDIQQLLGAIKLEDFQGMAPVDAPFIPQKVHSFRVQAPDPEDVLKNLEENLFPQNKKIEDKPLDIFEKGKLSFYEMFFSKDKEREETETQKTDFMKGLESLANGLGAENNQWADDMQVDYEELERRNQKHLDRLLDMLKNNPEEALKYAIPLDGENRGRGPTSQGGDIGWNLRWFNFSLFDNTGMSSGPGVDLGDDFFKLENQYRETAEALIEKGDYKKAAFIYMKLLKNYRLAAETLEKGHLFAEAASIYLEHVNDKTRAAKCYEAANMIHEAIDIYIEFNQFEKVGDLYVQINQPQKAMGYYQKTIDQYLSQLNHLKASLIARHKMGEEEKAQEILLKGWHSGKDPLNCLRSYFSNISNPKILKQEIKDIYQNEVSEHNRENYLNVLKSEYDKDHSFKEELREMAYEIVATEVKLNPDVVAHLRKFNPKDTELFKDTLRFKNKSKK